MGRNIDNTLKIVSVILFVCVCFYIRSYVANYHFSDSIIGRQECVKDCISGLTLRCPLRSVQYETLRVKRNLPNGEAANTRQESFQYIYQNHIWVHKGDHIPAEHREMHGSGDGSTLEYSVEASAVLHLLITDIKRILKKSKLTFLDIPCGDLVWMSRLLQSRTDIEYTGMDIVPKLIDHHKKKYPYFKFIHQDIVETPLSRSYDIIFCRLMLQHLKTHDVLTILRHFQESGSKYLLVTTFPGNPANGDLLDVRNNRFRKLNLELPPFSLSPPICLSRDGDNVKGIHYYLGLWKFPLLTHKSCFPNKFAKPGGAKIDFFACDRK